MSIHEFLIFNFFYFSNFLTRVLNTYRLFAASLFLNAKNRARKHRGGRKGLPRRPHPQPRILRSQKFLGFQLSRVSFVRLTAREN